MTRTKSQSTQIGTATETQPVLVSVCICTYKRPQLKTCLESIAEQNLPANYSLRFIVVDNCPEKSAAPIVRHFCNSYKFDVEYLSCPIKNLSRVRNTALKAATGQYVALVDDDEVVSANWLQSLVECSIAYDADIVIGPVYNQYSENCPEWIEKPDLMGRANPPTGKTMQAGLAGNALLCLSVLSRTTELFDERLGHVGGEDTDLFYRLYKMKAKIVACREAWASEIIDPERENLEYLIQENKRIGQVFCLVFWPSYNFIQKLFALTKILGKLALFGLVFLLTFIIGKRYSAYSKLRLVCNIEKIRYLLKGGQTIRKYCS